jgi:glycosyltransferase involved in cell wall biosynthesis
MQKKILVSGPLLSASGYGKMCRFALDALAEHPEKYDIYVNLTTWGQTGWLFEENDQYKWINALKIKTQQHVQTGGQFDIALQITIPNEWKRMAPINIGYTAGIETHVISPAWLEPSNLMDKVITISEFSKSGFMNTVFGNDKGQQFKVTTPVEVVHFPVEEAQAQESTLDLPSAYNFLTVNQWGPRKNMEALIKAFVDEFRDEDVGLVIKANTANDSIMDKIATESRLTALLASLGARKCRVHLVHGRMTDEAMAGLYRHNKIKAFVTATHGEGFGFPIFEAVNAGLPVVATDWSGHLDFLTGEDDKKLFAKVDFELKQIDPSHVWPGVMETQAAWAYPTVGSLRSRMREVYKDGGRFNSWAKKLAAHNKEKFAKQKIQEDFFYSLDIFYKPSKATLKNVEGISFCIPTNGKKREKTIKSINSIKNTCKNSNFSNYEISIAGRIEQFYNISGVNLINANIEADNGSLAKLRNICASNAKYDAIVFLDDDIVFEDDWIEKFLNFSKKNDWDILGNRILLPNGDRYWDRATFQPHTMVDYAHPTEDKKLYQTGCFWILRADVFKKHKWDASIEYYAENNGKINEDVEYSQRLIKEGYKLSFDEDNTVWHLDGRYYEKNLADGRKVCLRREIENTFEIKDFSYLDKEP